MARDTRKDSFIRGQDFILSLCQKLDIDSSNVHKVTIEAAIDDVVRITVEHFVDKRVYDVTALLD